MTSEKLYKIEEHPICGRQLVAKRRILAGELIIDEPALLTGPGFARGNVSHPHFHRKSQRNPAASSSDLPVSTFTQEDASVCLVCCANLTTSCIPCPLCGLLLCSEQCQQNVQHTDNECLIFPQIRHVWNEKANRSKKSLYNLVVVVRGLCYKFRDVTKWMQINNLDSKSEALVKIGGFEELHDVFSSFTWDMFASLPNPGSERKENNSNVSVDDTESVLEAAQHCLGVMRINAFSSFSESYSREGLFFISSFMSHSCIINTDRQIGVAGVVDPGGVRMVVRASVDIEKGEPITTTYLSLLNNTVERHRIMISSWLFVCSCKRCLDFRELELYSGAFICHQSGNAEGNLVCCCADAECSCQSNEQKERTIQKIIGSRPPDLNDVTKVENWLDSCDTGELLHPNHSLFAHIKLFLCQFYGRQTGGLDTLSLSQLKRKVAYCLQILSIFDKVCPGLQMCRGVVMFELWSGLRKLLELKELPVSSTVPKILPSSQLTPTRLSEMDIHEIKKKALEILKYAIPNSPEEVMAECLLDEDRDTY